MRPSTRELLLVAALALAVTMVVAAPVIRTPSRRVFGAAIVGHHHDPFTFMRQVEGRLASGVYLQPATDVPASVVARATGGVAAYNWIVLLTFPLSAAASFLLARHLGISAVWAGAAALLFAFSPFHLAHAAYHPHIAQTQWIPLYLLVLWRAVDAPSWSSVLALALVAAAAVLSNFYGGLIVIVMTPVALFAYWLCLSRHAPRAAARLASVAGALALMAAAGMAYAVYVFGQSANVYASYATAPEDIVRYGARWWSYLMPPVAHPLAGGWSRQRWFETGVDIGLLEQQVSLGWGLMGLAVVAVVAHRTAASRMTIVVLAAIACVAFVFSLSAGPAALLRDALPMFRAYARFGVVVQLMIALLAAIGAQHLWRRGRRGARAMCLVLLAAAVVEYAVWPPSMSRPVMPTEAHHWVAERAECLRVLDCAPAGPDAAAIQWLTHGRVTGSSDSSPDCAGPDLAATLAAHGFTHVLVRREAVQPRAGAWHARAGLPAAAHFADSDVYAVAGLSAGVPACGAGPWHR